jgi:hypothetical protein
MPTYTIILTDAEQKAMEYISTDVDFWIQNAVHERARRATEEMVTDHIRSKLAAGEPVAGTEEEIVMATELPNAQARHEANMQLMLDVSPPLPPQEAKTDDPVQP